MDNKMNDQAKRSILQEVAAYYCSRHQNREPFKPGDRIPYAGRVFDQEELINLVDAALDFWLTTGEYAHRFENEFAGWLGARHAALVNSGSSANLLAFMALTSPLLEDRRILPGDEVITVAAGFPTTVAPMIQYGAVPVFVDVSLPEYNLDCRWLEEALSPHTKAVMLAHTLGNPFDIQRVRDFCDAQGLWLVEDACDALGSRIMLDGQWRSAGTIGHLGTFSFYPPHHMTMGEGGCVCTHDPLLHRIVVSMRDWGRDCICPSGQDDTCRQRFTRQYGELPLGYDHKYVYSHFGYNLKATDLQAAIGCAQLKKLPAFVAVRRHNWRILREGLAPLSSLFVLPEPAEGTEPSWFGFILTVREDSGLTRDQAVRWLESRRIQTRPLFAGNLLRHPCFDEMRKTGRGYRVVGNLVNTDVIMNSSFWVGVYPGMTRGMLDYIIETLTELAEKGKGGVPCRR
ncbi:MAG TPA: lipopolysaccharide biosynthesis protein RfbH [Clostridiales bacterium]|nr:lipopolysaccharide biosynthesis protein RfbH [Clostridiales bacterium]